ncbi:hypothetical protein ACFQY7_23800 [Actinomadura luteofluorescens]|uniref:hypothetical protein n=1 Tax=Actinomadura luteofluorescens TaxID=46163 RepID=UPI00363D9B93
MAASLPHGREDGVAQARLGVAGRRPPDPQPPALDAELLLEAVDPDVGGPGQRVLAGAAGDLVEPPALGDPCHRRARPPQVVVAGEADPHAVQRPVGDVLPACGALSPCAHAVPFLRGRAPQKRRR